jgi:kynurenine 3-monooxygenase
LHPVITDRPDHAAPIAVVGAGMVGCVAAICLARRFGRVDVFERSDPLESAGPRAARSLTVILSARAWRVLDRLGLSDRVRELCVPLSGRQAHLPDGSGHFTRYGRRGQRIWSVLREDLHKLLVSAARETPGVTMHHGAEVVSANLDEPSLRVSDGRLLRCEHVIGCDGAHSVVRKAFAAAGARCTEQTLPLGYKEIDVPAAPGWRHQRTAFHYWPRTDALFGAFPDRRGGYCGSLFLPLDGAKRSFEGLTDTAEVRRLFADVFGDLAPLIDDLDRQFQDRPVSTITTTHSDRWTHRGTAVLLGDAAHAMAPFMGQGMNCGFEDVLVLDDYLTGTRDWAAALAAYERGRRPDAEAIVDLSLDHYRNLASDPAAQEPPDTLLERLCHLLPDEFVPFYERCAFGHDGYAAILRDWHVARALAGRLIAVHGAALLAATDEAVRTAALALPETRRRS